MREDEYELVIGHLLKEIEEKNKLIAKLKCIVDECLAPKTE